MSNLITSKEEIKKIYDCLELLRSQGYTVRTIEEILERLIIQNDKYLIDFQVIDDDGLFIEPACFVPDEKLVKVSLKVLRDYLNYQTRGLRCDPGNEEIIRKDLFDRMILYTIIHENEHVKQFLIGEELIDCSYRTVINLYNNMFSFCKCDEEYKGSSQRLVDDLETLKKLLFYFSKHRNSYKFFLERNANVIANDVMIKLCEYEEDMTFNDFFYHQKSCEVANGYSILWNGPAERSYYKLLSGKTFKRLFVNEEISTEDKVCYGLPVDVKTRVRIMQKKYEL